MTAKRVDQNQPEIVKEFRRMGATVQIISNIGKGCPDIIVGYKGVNYLIEIKKDEKAKLTPHEEVFFLTWRGQVCKVFCKEDVIKLMEKADEKNVIAML